MYSYNAFHDDYQLFHKRWDFCLIWNHLSSFWKRLLMALYTCLGGEGIRENRYNTSAETYPS